MRRRQKRARQLRKCRNDPCAGVRGAGDDGEPGDLAVNIGDLTTPEDSSLAERNREAVQHLYQPYYLAAFPPPPHHACFRKLFDAERQNSGQDPWRRWEYRVPRRQL